MERASTPWRPSLLALLALVGCGGGTPLATPETDASAPAEDTPGALDAPPTDGPTWTDCSAVGCTDAVLAADLVTASADVLRATTVRVCFNTTCAEGRPGEFPSVDGVGLPWSFPTGTPATGVVRRAGADRYSLSVAFLARGNLRDGDRYLVRATHAPTGTVVALVDESVRYRVSTPNGPGCPPLCRTAALTVRRTELPRATDAPGDSFEIFPTVTPTSALRGGAMPHSNPLRASIAVAVGSSATFGWRYYNFGGERSTAVRAVEVSGADGGPLDPSFTLGGPLRVGFDVMSSTFEPQATITFRPTATTRAQARVRVRFDHGYYDTVVDAATE